MFYRISDDRSKLYIDDQLIVDNDGDYGVIERYEDVTLKKGMLHLVVDVFDRQFF